jgi:hypothetical protein
MPVPLRSSSQLCQRGGDKSGREVRTSDAVEKHRGKESAMDMTTDDLLWLTVFMMGAILAVAWILLPFALFGTKALLKQLIAETQRTNTLLEVRRSL